MFRFVNKVVKPAGSLSGRYLTTVIGAVAGARI